TRSPPLSATRRAIEPEHPIEYRPNGSISGVVYLEDGVTPAEGALVQLRGGAFDEYDLVSDAEGRFTFELVPPGRYHLTATYDQGVLFRQERVYAQMRRHGDEMDVELTLQAQGRVEGYVLDAGGNFVSGAVVELRERGFPFRTLVHNADESGQFSFDNIFEGELTLRARAPTLGGLGGHECAEMTFEGELVQVEITLEGTADLQGHVTHPGTGAAIPNARVAIHRSGGSFVDSTQTDGDGFYEIRALRLLDYEVRVFDPATGRRGLSSRFTLDEHGQSFVQDVVLEARGVVEGHLYDPDANNQGVPGATLQLHSRGIRWFTTYSSTGIDGDYSFEGIPEGPFDVKTHGQRRRASGEGQIEQEDQVVQLDLYLAPQGRLFGQVYSAPRFEGDPGELFQNVNLTVRESSGPVDASSDNPFEFSYLRPRASLKLLAEEINGPRISRYSFRLDLGEDREQDLRMRAIGSVKVRALTSTGVPVVGASVRVINSYTHATGAPSDQRHGLSRQSFEGGTGDGHEVSFQNVRQGWVDARVSDPQTGLSGRAVGLLEWEDQELVLDVQLQPNGWVRGQILMPDGVTPAAGANVALDAAERSWQQQAADEQGRFEFDSVPLGGYRLVVQENGGPGSFELDASLDVDQEIDDYTLVLDDADPFVVSVDPPFDSRDVSRDLDVVITFSEPIRDCGSCSSQLYIQRISASQYPTLQRLWNAERTQVTLRPTAPLNNDTGYKIVIRTGLEDEARRNLAWEVVSSFYTADTEPPEVIDIRPAGDAVEVPVDSGLEITFSEPVALASLSGAFAVTDLTTGQPLTVTTLPSLDDRRVVLTPTSDFATDRQIEVRVTGVADGAGNAMPTPFAWSFWTPDVTLPTISWTSPASGQSYTAGDTVNVAADIADNRGLASVTYRLGDWSLDLAAPPFEWSVPAPVVEQAGAVSITVEATDIYGNLATSSREIFVEPLGNAAPPAVAVGCPADGDWVAPGVLHPVTFSVSDDEAVESAWILVDGLRVDRQTPIDAESAAVELAWTPPEDALPGQSFDLRLETRDFAGQVTSVPMTLTVPTVDLLAGDQALPGSSGDVALAAGTYSLDESGDFARLTLLHGAFLQAADGTRLAASSVRQQCGSEARLVEVALSGDLVLETGSVLGPPRLQPLSVQAAGITVESGALIDGVEAGYWGESGVMGRVWSPEGRETPHRGAAHGGMGIGDRGESYDSVYVPRMFGGGGADAEHIGGRTGASGGGMVLLEAQGTVRLDGLVDVSGSDGVG
ncbi:MAG: carboxypeptidase regulatory-like domain-containing protein, partial [Acidobacteriota bacterium]